MSNSVDAEQHSVVERSGTPRVCRITVVSQGVEVDISLPADTVLASLLPGVVTAISDHRATRRTGAEPEPPSGHGYALTTLAGDALNPGRSLAELGVRDGDLLVLHAADSVPPPPLFDDVVDAVSASSTGQRWTAQSARYVGFGTAMVASAAAGATALFAPTPGLLGGTVALVLALGLAVVGCAVGVLRHDRATGTVLNMCSTPLAFAGGVIVVPGTEWAPGGAVGAAAASALAVLALRFGDGALSVLTSVALVTFVLCVGCLVVTITDSSPSNVSAVVAGACVLSFTWAPRMAVLHSRLPLPRVPVSDSSALFDHTDPAVVESYETVQDRTAAAQEYLTGYVTGLSVAAAAAVLLSVALRDSAGFDVAGIVSASVVGAVLVLRGRTFVDRIQAATPIIAGTTVALGLLALAAVSTPAMWPVWTAGFAAVGVLALAFGVAAPAHSFSPVMRRTAELIEFAAIATVIPSICWVIDLFALVRAL